MKLNKEQLELYLVTDRQWTGNQSLLEQVEESIQGGVSIVQLREKNLDDESFLKEAIQMKELTSKYGIPFIVNDNVLVALHSEADGIHIGQNDLAIQEVRKMVGPHRIIGVSAQTVEQAITAQQNGADYLGVGAVFSTTTKSDAVEVSYETLKAICEAVTIPVVAIGGITVDNVHDLKGSGIDGIAIVSAILAQKNIKKAAEDLRKELAR